jgi:DNA repair protein SbcD/Mre11
VRFIHTADWHLGRSLYGYSLLNDQQHLLNQMIEFVLKESIDVVFISGDIFDRALPPAEALSLLDYFVSEVILRHKSSVVIIPGNHDSSLRLAFGSKLLKKESLHIASSPLDLYHPIHLFDQFGPIRIHSLPYFEPFKDTVFQPIPFSPKVRRILLAHLFVKEGESTDSERYIGGLNSTPTHVFDDFHYVALGHLHKAQRWGNIAYSGSPMKYSLSEVEQDKGFYFGELTTKLSLEFVSLTPQRDLLLYTGSLGTILQKPPTTDFVSVVLEDSEVIYDTYNKLKQHFPHLLQIQRTKPANAVSKPVGKHLLEEKSICSDFFHYVLDRELLEKEKNFLAEIVLNFEAKEREGLCSSVS